MEKLEKEEISWEDLIFGLSISHICEVSGHLLGPIFLVYCKSEVLKPGAENLKLGAEILD